MLADGNSVESVAHVMEVPVDTVLAWRAQEQAPASTPASAPAVATLPALPAIHFDDELSYATPAGSRIVIALVGFGMVAVSGFFAIS